MNERERLIKAALAERLDELRGARLTRLEPDDFGDAAPFAAEVRGLCGAATAVADLKHAAAHTRWAAADADCLDSLRALALGRATPLRPVPEPEPAELFVKALHASRNDPERRFRLLAERYRWPLNFGLSGEDVVRERVLTRLMARDRARVERETVGAVDADDLLLRLNLLALYAPRASDLRFLDALNYYYELLPAGWRPRGRNPWLLPSYLALYARALAARIG